jgi:osmotically-inducible protein OsmY
MRSTPVTRPSVAGALVLGLALIAGPAWAANRGVCSARHADADLATQVRAELLAVPLVDGSPGVHVRVHEGVVTLAGTVPSLQARREAVRAARAVRHVRAIVDLIQVAPAFRTDTELEHAVRAALARDRDADAADVSVFAADGVVTLTGLVGSAQQRMDAVEAARSVPGVARVRNLIDFNNALVRPDREIWTDIRRAIDDDLLLQPAVINVGVHDGAVTLTGFVATAAQRAAAVDDAWTSGVWRVTDRLGRAGWADEASLKDRVPLPDDGALRSNLLAALRQDPRTAGDRIDVTVIAGVATLSGQTRTLAAKQAAVADADNTPGVAQTLDVLRVRPVPGNGALAARVRKALKRDPDLRHYDLGVRIVRGEVYVNGEVISELDHQAVLRVVAGVPGVTGIEDQVVPNHTRPLPGDEQIARRSRLWLYLAAPLPLHEVSIAVKDRVAVLDGQVPSLLYRSMAEGLARQAGALRVRDRLRVGG